MLRRLLTGGVDSWQAKSSPYTVAPYGTREGFWSTEGAREVRVRRPASGSGSRKCGTGITKPLCVASMRDKPETMEAPLWCRRRFKPPQSRVLSIYAPPPAGRPASPHPGSDELHFLNSHPQVLQGALLVVVRARVWSCRWL